MPLSGLIALAISNKGWFNMDSTIAIDLGMDFSSLTWWNRYREGLNLGPEMYGRGSGVRFSLYFW